MLGQYKIIGGKGYLQINNNGTLQKLPKIPWWWEAWFLIKSNFKNIHINEIKNIAIKK